MGKYFKEQLNINSLVGISFYKVNGVGEMGLS